MQYIKRELSGKLSELSRKFPVIAVTGPRQSGKTTLAKLTFPEYKYVSLEDRDNREFASTDPRTFLSQYKGGSIIDEIQKCPDLLSYIQTHTDKNKMPGEFIITGSENLLMAQSISQTLAGRAAYIKLLPFSINELHRHSDFNDYEEYIFRGFYPRIYDLKINPTDWYPNYINTYIEKDVRQLKNIDKLNVFEKFLKLCASGCGQILNYSSMANDCGVSHNTISSWIGILEANYIVYLLKPHHNNFNKRIIKMPKLYFYDTGLACSLLGLNSTDDVNKYFHKGALFENLIVSELLKKRYNAGKPDNLFFWRDKTGHEIDLVIDNGAELVPVEIKSSRTVSAEFFKNLKFYCNVSGIDQIKSAVVYGGEQNQNRAYGCVLGFKSAEGLLK
ncbi:MAG TPA: ATP-binding protein [Clostridiales bacterium]|nr:ATP-binding protein [Clostridiales bacterium]HQP69107.1 ATP-binding protein [Clostridiales bacterium]